jgi:hypothetical protein
MARTLLGGIAATIINTRPDEDWLVVFHKDGMEGTSNFRRDVRQHPDFRAALYNHDIAEAQVLGDNRRGFLRPRFVEALSGEVIFVTTRKIGSNWCNSSGRNRMLQ